MNLPVFLFLGTFLLAVEVSLEFCSFPLRIYSVLTSGVQRGNREKDLD